MQRPTLVSLNVLLVLGIGACIGGAEAGEYTYAMAAAEAAGTTSTSESAGAGGVGANNRVEGMGARYLVSQEEAPATAAQRDEDDAAVVLQPTAPSGSSGGSVIDKRASHRWQALVPGAIK